METVSLPVPRACEEYTDLLHFYLNGKPVTIQHPDPELTLLQYVRDAGFTGTKLGCGEGGCGACTIMVSRWDGSAEKVQHLSVNGCLLPLCAVDGAAVTTVEGLGSTRRSLSDVQSRLATAHGSQCGFCTPGFVVALHTFLREHPEPSKTELEHCFDGNLCRCTGYRPILDAAKSFECGSSGACSTGGNAQLTSDIAFPEELKTYDVKPLCFVNDKAVWIRPTSLVALLDVMDEKPVARILNGNTECGIETKIKGRRYETLIHPGWIQELREIQRDDDVITIGAAVTLLELGNFCRALRKEIPRFQRPILKAILYQLKYFAGTQIRNTAAVGGNICTASPISDLNPVWLAANATFELMSKAKGVREVPATEFFLDYRKTAVQAGEVLRKVRFKLTGEHEYFRTYKQARRRDDDIAIVTAALRVKLERQEDDAGATPCLLIKECSLAYGGVDKIPVRAPKTEEALCGQRWDENGLALAMAKLAQDIDLPPNAPGGMVKFRQSLTTSFFYKFYLHVLREEKAEALDAAEMSAIDPVVRPVSTGSQTYKGQGEEGDQALMHVAAQKQVSGEAIYTEDFPLPSSALFGAFVKSTHARAAIVIDYEELRKAALSHRGVVELITHHDIVGDNECGAIFREEEVFAEKEVVYVGQPLALVVAKSHDDAAFAVSALERHSSIQYDTQGKEPIITIEQAIKHNSFFPNTDRVIDTGNVDEEMAKADHVVEGETFIGAQEHFYLETNITVAFPGEGKEMEILTSSQNPSRTQYVVADVLGVPANRVNVKVKRLGGGFGGKETRNIFVSAAAAVGAQKMGVPVRLALDRHVDMLVSGTRHPFFYKYKVGFTKEGKLVALDTELYGNAGFSIDLSVGVLERGVYHVQNAYYIPAIRASGKLCKTNVSSRTAFRGFGGPQAMFMSECYIERVARFLGKPVEEIRGANLYKNGDLTHYRMKLDHCHLPKMWSKLRESCEFERRLAEVNKFNSENRWLKRGIAMVPTMYGMSFTIKFLNQAGALVHLYRDGSVLVSHGGVEMGQGLHTKMTQVAARTLGVDVSQVYISETATDKVSNTSPTAASVSSDLNGLAVINACEQLNARLAPYKEKHPDASWTEILDKAYFDRVNLSANGFYATPGIDSFFTCGAAPFNYFNYGVACAEVQVDCLTGDYWIPRVDVLMDVGESLNPSIDIGQIEGAFVQGMGLFTLEEVVLFRNGQLFTRGPGSYKIPTGDDIPVDFRVELLADAPNHRPAPFSSKGVGEPPLFLSSSVFFAIKEAVAAARVDNMLEPYVPIPSPATCERIRNACGDRFVEQFKDKETEW